MRITVLTCIFVLSGILSVSADVTPPATSSDANELDQRISKLISQLGSPDYPVRERSAKELTRLGLDAFDALTLAKESDDLEIAAQARFLVRQIRFDWTRESDPPALQDELKNYEGQAAGERLARIRRIAEMTDLASLEWLCRLARFEESSVLAKEAALKVMERSVPVDSKAADEHFAVIARTIERGKRPAVMWLKAFIKERKDPDAAIASWDEVIAGEEQVLDKPTETTPRLVSDLLRRQVGLLESWKRPEDAQRMIHKMVQIERGDAASLLGLLDWLRERKAWSAVDEVAAKFTALFDSEPMLGYALAQTRLAQGNKELAEAAAAKAFANHPDQLQEHFTQALVLQQRGLKDWADREFRYLIEKHPLASDESIRIRVWFSEDLHDRQRDAEAAAVLKDLVVALDRKEIQVQRVLNALGKEEGSTRSRMLFFEASAAGQHGDIARQTQLLDQGIAADPNDADVLIGLYRLPNPDTKRRQEIKEMIAKAVTISRKEIDDNPDDPTPYNQMAWLVANTEGDFEEAIRLSQKSIELLRSAGESRSVGGYLDTLSHCYFAKGDYENAVKTQTEAASLEPNSEAIARQLKVFKEALEKKQAKTN